MPSSRLDMLFGAALQALRQDPRGDAELLARFLDQRDEAAFEALVVRHTPAVRAACRTWLRSPADVDDAAQATFLVLVQRGHAIRNRPALGRWLSSVAVNVARRLRRQQKVVSAVPENLPDRTPAEIDDLTDLLHEEIARLPEKYRLPVQMCYAAGLTTAQAAERLGWPKGTVLTRLAWARARLQKRLASRGITPATLAAMLAGLAVPAVRSSWIAQTVQAALKLRAGAPASSLGVSGRTLSLTRGVVRAMVYDRFKYVIVAALLAVGLGGLGLGHWAAASHDGPERKARAGDPDARGAIQRPTVRDREAEESEPPPPNKEGRPSVPGRRREAVIRLPQGTFVREVDASPYGWGRLTWTYEDERVLGIIEGSVRGCEFEVATEAEYSLSSTGAIYGLVTSVQLNHLRLSEEVGLEEFRPFVAAAEPLLNEMVLDLPFSYHFRVQGDRLIISNFRMLLAGPNPLGKLGGLASGSNGLEALSYFQALGTAIEGTYSSGARERGPAGKRPKLRRSDRPAGMAPLILPGGRNTGHRAPPPPIPGVNIIQGTPLPLPIAGGTIPPPTNNPPPAKGRSPGQPAEDP